MEWLHSIFAKSPEIALFLCLSLGYLLGKVKFGKFQLGGVAGSLLVAVLVSQVGVHVDAGVKAVLFALFIYAVGYESGPKFFSSLGKQSIKEIIMAAVMAATGLLTVVIMAKLFALDKGLAAGIAAGGLTQSAIIGTASDAITKLGLDAGEVARLQGNVAVGYAVTYVFGSFGAIIVCVNILPKLMGRGIRDDAIKAEMAMNSGVQVLGQGQANAVTDLVGRLYQLNQANSIAKIEDFSPSAAITIEKVKRGSKLIAINPTLELLAGDIILIVGRRDSILEVAPQLGTEVFDVDGMDLIMQRSDVIFSNQEFSNKTLQDIRLQAKEMTRHGIFLEKITRAGTALPMQADTVIELGDVVSIYGAEQDVKKASAIIGVALIPSPKTDFVYMGAGLVVGLLVGLLSAKIGSIPLTLGSGGGALLSGLLFGWYRSKHQTFGEMPQPAVQLLKDLGLAGFVTVVGLTSGLQAVETIQAQGFTIFGVGMVVTILPMLITMLFGRYILNYDNTAILAGALSGSRSANPAFGEVLDKAENSIPTVPFAITYALANVFLTLLGPLIVAFV